MNHPPNDHAGWFRDVREILTIAEQVPGLPLPRITPARASFDYRHVVHAEDAREAVACAVAVLAFAFKVTFTEETETAGDGTPRYLLVALLPSGLPLVLVSRFEHADLLDEIPAAAERRPELAVA